MALTSTQHPFMQDLYCDVFHLGDALREILSGNIGAYQTLFYIRRTMYNVQYNTSVLAACTRHVHDVFHFRPLIYCPWAEGGEGRCGTCIEGSEL